MGRPIGGGIPMGYKGMCECRENVQMIYNVLYLRMWQTEATICTFSHLHILTFAHSHIYTFSHLHILTFAHLHICTLTLVLI